jgi:hypothetical protein
MKKSGFESPLPVPKTLFSFSSARTLKRFPSPRYPSAMIFQYFTATPPALAPFPFSLVASRPAHFLSDPQEEED